MMAVDKCPRLIAYAKTNAALEDYFKFHNLPTYTRQRIRVYSKNNFDSSYFKKNNPLGELSFELQDEVQDFLKLSTVMKLLHFRSAPTAMMDQVGGVINQCTYSIAVINQCTYTLSMDYQVVTMMQKLHVDDRQQVYKRGDAATEHMYIILSGEVMISLDVSMADVVKHVNQGIATAARLAGGGKSGKVGAEEAEEQVGGQKGVLTRAESNVASVEQVTVSLDPGSCFGFVHPVSGLQV
jgi:CRP-like cAMP-binding protein